MERSILDTLEILSNGGQIQNNNDNITGISGKIKREFESILNCPISPIALLLITIYFVIILQLNQIKPNFFEDENIYKKIEKRLTSKDISDLRKETSVNKEKIQQEIKNILTETGFTIPDMDDFIDGLLKHIDDSGLLNKKRNDETRSALFGVIYVYLYTKTVRNILETKNTVSSLAFGGFSLVNLGLWINGGLLDPLMIGYAAACIMGLITVIVNERQKIKNNKIQENNKKEIQEWLETAISLLNDFAQGDNPGFLYNFDGDNPKTKFVGNLKFGELLGINDDKIFNLSKDELFAKIFGNNQKEIKRAEKFIKGELEEEPVFDIINKDGEKTKMIWNTKKLKGSGVINIFLSYEEILKQRKVIIPYGKKEKRIERKNARKDVKRARRILEQAQKQGATRRLESILREKIEKMPDPAVAYDNNATNNLLESKPLFWNKAMERVTGYTFSEIKDMTQKDIMELLYGWSEDELERVMSHLHNMNASGKGYNNTVFTLITKKGRELLEQLKNYMHNNIEIDDNVIDDIKKQIEMEKRQIVWHADKIESSGRVSIGSLDQAIIREALRKDSSFDCLNKRALEEDYNKVFSKGAGNNGEINTSRRSTDKQATERLSLGLCDINRFKHFNDTYGHAAGDFVLSHVIETIKSQIRVSDGLYRIGGDEFVLMMTADKDILMNKLEKIINILACTNLIIKNNNGAEKFEIIKHETLEEAQEYFTYNNTDNLTRITPPILTSWGISEASISKPKELSVIKKEADTAMYVAKDGSKNKGEKPVLFYSEEVMKKFLNTNKN